MTDTPLPSRKAGLWARYMARSIDMLAFQTVINALIWVSYKNPLLLMMTHDARHSLIVQLLITLPVGIITSVAYLTADAFIYNYFGNTLGKKLLGLRAVQENHAQLTLRDYLRRNGLIFVLAYACGIRFVGVVTLLINMVIARRTGTTFWDRRLHSTVIAPSASRTRTSLLTVLFVMATLSFSLVMGVPLFMDTHHHNILMERTFNSKLPISTTPDFTLTRIDVYGTHIIYNTTLKGALGERLHTNPDLAEAVRTHTTAAYKHAFCTTKQPAILRLYHRIFETSYAYQDSAGDKLFSVTLNNDLCQPHPSDTSQEHP